MVQEFESIIIRMPNWIGDAVMATPIIADLRQRWPHAQLTAMCQGSALSSLLRGNPHLNEIFSFTRPNSFMRREEHRNIISRLRQGKYELGVLLPNSLSSAWWFWRGGVKTRLGFAKNLRNTFLTNPIPLPQELGKEHLVITYKRLLLSLGIPLSHTAPALYLTRSEKEAARQLLEEHHIPEKADIIGINPGAAYGSAKCWLPERFRALIDKLVQRPNTYILCFADQTGTPLVNAICKQMPPQVINLAGTTTLRELIALIERCAVFLTNDSGPMHIAAALKVPLVALFGSTNEVVTGPYEHGLVIHKHLSCSPCLKRVCPIDFRCMKGIEVDEVHAALLKLLKN